ncbi:probable fatty acid methyltransferase [Phtheirospermum japonicum]|uniref:Probable fatty acid methyltransferase n=1 Tax=Phtheirospermum japonicum TaxID=374723 RepID=A0A830DIH6_9LAMI|nr:probable fatty acid methyltransferase [Phtheirospermum japonicum]
MSKMRVAVVGGGVSGLVAAYVAAEAGVEVALYEKDDYLGGHAKTVTIDGTSLDLGFMVFNRVTYPNMMELFESLGVDMELSDMSFAVSLDKGIGCEWGSRNGFSGLFAQKKNILNPYFWKMIKEVIIFKDDVLNYLEGLDNNPDIDRNETLGHFVQSRGYSELFQKAYLIPICGSIWSCSSEGVMSFSAYSILSFCRNHHLLQLFGRPQWLTVRRRSQNYVKRIRQVLESKGCRIRTNAEVCSVSSNEVGCSISCKDGSEDTYDQCIIAAHAPDALKMLGKQATSDEIRILGAFQYAYSDVYLHRDKKFMPQNTAAWSAWNFLGTINKKVCVTYWLNVLQNIRETGLPFLVTLNPPSTPEHTLLKWSTGHPIPSVAATKASTELNLIQGKRRIWFCGAYQGSCTFPLRYGFHEDGLKVHLCMFSLMKWAGPVLNSFQASLWSPSPAHAENLSHNYAGPTDAAAQILKKDVDYMNLEFLQAGMLAANGLLRKHCTLKNNPKHMVPSWLETGGRLLVTRFLERFIAIGCITLLEDGGTMFVFEGTRKTSPLKVCLRIHSPQFYWKIANEADLGLADAYINGDFSFVDKNEGLLNLFMIFIVNRDLSISTSNVNNKGGWWTPLLFTSALASAKYFFQHMSRKNTLTQARRNISRHYDLSNELFSLFLDETMTYSCAIFKTKDEDLKIAQYRKISLLIEKARVSKNHHVLEIGCGWGTLAIEVVKRTGCKYTGITLSEEQLKYAEIKVKEAGLQDHIEFLLYDSRQLPKIGKYDRIISCKMLEVIGHEYMENFFQCCDSVLEDDRLLVLQFISIPDGRYDEYKRSSDFIKEYIFSDGSIEVVKRTGCKYTGITLSQEQLKYAEIKVKEAGLQDHIKFLLCDYRQLPESGKYDRIISCEMLEAVGHEYMEDFFQCCDSVLEDDGLLVLQFISIPDGRYDEYRRSSDFIKEYIFPGGCLPSLSRVMSAMAAASRLCAEHLEDIGIHYYQTLRYWRENFLGKQREIQDLGFDEKFIRTWEYYFDYCSAGFKTCTLGNYQQDSFYYRTWIQARVIMRISAPQRENPKPREGLRVDNARMTLVYINLQMQESESSSSESLTSLKAEKDGGICKRTIYKLCY